jgi:hypothetical protein
MIFSTRRIGTSLFCPKNSEPEKAPRVKSANPVCYTVEAKAVLYKALLLTV